MGDIKGLAEGEQVHSNHVKLKLKHAMNLFTSSLQELFDTINIFTVVCKSYLTLLTYLQ